MRIEFDIDDKLFYREDLAEIEEADIDSLEERYNRRKCAISMLVEAMRHKIEHVQNIKSNVKTYIVLQSKMNKN